MQVCLLERADTSVFGFSVKISVMFGSEKLKLPFVNHLLAAQRVSNLKDERKIIF